MPSREAIDATFAKMREFSTAGDMRSWAGFFREDATFTNSALAEPVVGRDAIIAMTEHWPRVETEIEVCPPLSSMLMAMCGNTKVFLIWWRCKWLWRLARQDKGLCSGSAHRLWLIECNPAPRHSRTL